MVTDGEAPTGDGGDGGSAERDEGAAAPIDDEPERSGDPDANESVDAVRSDDHGSDEPDPDEQMDAGDAEPTDAGDAEPAGADENAEPTDEEIVAAASDAAEGLVFSRYRRSDVRDVDVTVGFADGVLSVDVYLNVPDADVSEHVDDEAEQVADDAALAALDAVDRLFEERGE